MKRPLIILTGPTAVGKTALSIQLAKAIGGEIISADSMQVYQYMDIGSAKIRRDEMDGVPHYLVDVLKPEEEFHVVRFQEMAKEAMEKIYANNHIPQSNGGCIIKTYEAKHCTKCNHYVLIKLITTATYTKCIHK